MSGQTVATVQGPGYRGERFGCMGDAATGSDYFASGRAGCWPPILCWLGRRPGARGVEAPPLTLSLTFYPTRSNFTASIFDLTI